MATALPPLVRASDNEGSERGRVGRRSDITTTQRMTLRSEVATLVFDEGKIRQMTKIWNSGMALRDLGWA